MLMKHDDGLVLDFDNPKLLNDKAIRKLLKIFVRTLNNCRFYEKEKRRLFLLNEIGVLRGIAYALEAVGIHQYPGEFGHYIDVQNEINERVADINEWWDEDD